MKHQARLFHLASTLIVAILSLPSQAAVSDAAFQNVVQRLQLLEDKEAIRHLLEENFGGPLPADSMLRHASHVLTNVVIEVAGDTATARSRWALLSPSREDGAP